MKDAHASDMDDLRARMESLVGELERMQFIVREELISRGEAATGKDKVRRPPQADQHACGAACATHAAATAGAARWVQRADR